MANQETTQQATNSRRGNAQADGDSGLDRTIGPWLLTVFVVGNILGAGVYAIVGEVAKEAGGALWAPFVGAGILAGITAFAYVELVTKYPQAGGAALYVGKAFGRPWLTVMVAVGVSTAAITSAATSARAFGGQYLSSFVDLPVLPVAVGLVLVLTALNWFGIDESLGVNVVMTAVVVAGLFLVVGVGIYAYVQGDADTSRLFDFGAPDRDISPFLAVLGGTALAFFSFVGFEDTAQIAEETESPSRTFPIALFGGMTITLVIYLAVSVAASIVVPPGDLAGSTGPLVTVVEAGSSIPGWTIAAVALVALTNTALLQLVAASRLLYGIAKKDLLPDAFASVSESRGTPWVSVGVVGALAAVLTATGDLGSLADTTVMLLLTVFTVVNISVLKLRSDHVGHEHATAPTALPIIGAVVSAALVVYTAIDSGVGVVIRFAALLGAGLLIHLVQKLIADKTDWDDSYGPQNT